MIPRLLAGILCSFLLLQVPDRWLKNSKKVHDATTTLEASGDPWGCPKRPIEPVVISPDRILVTACNSLYMLDEKKQVVWKWTTNGPAITAQPVVDSAGEIHVIAFDLIWVALDASTGSKKWEKDSNGRAVYTQMKAYRDDQYLVVVNMEGYRESLEQDLPDGLVLCRGQREIWAKDFPANATLQVWGDRILAMTAVKGRSELVEIPTD